MRRIDYAAVTEKPCSKCQETKPVSEFHRYKDASAPLTGWRYHSRCIACNRKECQDYGATHKPQRNASLRQWRKANPVRAKLNDRRKRYRSKYGLTLEAVDALYKQAGDRCEICGSSRATLCIDHCRTTGRVRGILCPACNTFLGRIENNSGFLGALETYLRERCHK